MKYLIVVALITGLVGTTAAQIKIANFKKLQEFLPTAAPKEYVKQKPKGQTMTQMGMSQSYAEVRFIKKVENQTPDGMETEELTVSAKIEDYVMMPMALNMFQMQGEFENETENGYEKSVKVGEKYAGKEEANTTAGSLWCKISFGVGQRFLVTLEGSGISDAKLLHETAMSMPFEKMEKLAAGGQ